MNEAHRAFLASPEWAEMLEDELVPWLRRAGDLGDDVIEIGPGPGLTTDILRRDVQKVTAVELDDQLAAALAARLAGTNVEVIHRDATDTGLPDGRFSAAACFSMLHHVPSHEEQDRLLREMYRVLRPGGILVAVDSADHAGIRAFHENDVFVPLDPDDLPARLRGVGFDDVVVERSELEIRFHATKSPTIRSS